MKTRNILIALFSCCFLALVGCSKSMQARDLDNQGSGFLSNYHQLKEGKDGRALLVYEAPGVDWSRYRKVNIQPVVVYAPPKSDIAELDANQRLALVNYFYAAIRKELGQSLSLTKSIDSSTILVRVAITDAESSNRISETVSSIVPIGMALSGLKRVAFGRPIGVGDVQVEAEFLDAATGQQLAAAIDRRVGGRSASGKFDKWADAKDSFDHWAQRMHSRYIELKRAPQG